MVSHMNKTTIENKVHELHCQIWASVPENERPESVEGLIDLLNPEYAANLLGIEVWRMDTLGSFGNRGDKFEVAGVLERNRNLIAVSEKFPSRTVRFTLAHELGNL